jgi:hypothetical protein
MKLILYHGQSPSILEVLLTPLVLASLILSMLIMLDFGVTGIIVVLAAWVCVFAGARYYKQPKK